jgi:hypothetical protein
LEKLMKDWKIEDLMFETPEKLNPDSYPAAFNLSAEHFFQFVPVPKEIMPPEFVYVSLPKSPRFTDEEVAISNWNLMWEAGHLRPQGVVELPNGLSWVKDFQGTNLYLLPGGSPHKYETLGVLFHLLPQKTVEMFGLRLMKQEANCMATSASQRPCPGSPDERFLGAAGEGFCLPGLAAPEQALEHKGLLERRPPGTALS